MTLTDRTRKFIRYGLVSLSVFFLSIGVTWLGHEILHFSEEAAYGIALVLAFICMFILMRHYVFRVSDQGAKTQLTLYLTSSVAFRLAEFAGFLLLHTLLDVYYLLAVMLVLSTSWIAKYLVNRHIVFPSSTSHKPHAEDNAIVRSTED